MHRCVIALSNRAVLLFCHCAALSAGALRACFNKPDAQVSASVIKSKSVVLQSVLVAPTLVTERYAALSAGALRASFDEPNAQMCDIIMLGPHRFLLFCKACRARLRPLHIIALLC